jgi:hypothetical protein
MLIAVGVLVIAFAVAAALRRRRTVDPPTQPSFAAPRQIDRRDFPEVEAPWLVAVFSSATCVTCADVVAKADVLRCSQVGVVDVEYSGAPELHRKYKVDAVPIAVIADRDGVVRASFVGPMSATDLWAAVAEVRNPGSSPEPQLGQ